MLAGEMALDGDDGDDDDGMRKGIGMSMGGIPADHPGAHLFSPDRPYLDRKFDLGFCDGQVLRTYPQAGCRRDASCEAGRLQTSQLALEMQRGRDAGGADAQGGFLAVGEVVVGGGTGL